MPQGYKVPSDVVKEIRKETEHLFEEGVTNRGLKIKEYDRLAKKFGLSRGTVAAIARRNIHTDVR